MERAKNEQRVILAYDDSTCLFDDQYSMLLWGKLTLTEFSTIIKRINKSTAPTTSQIKSLNIWKGVVLSVLALSFFVLPGVVATVMKSKSYVSAVVLASGGMSGVAFFAFTILFIYLHKKIDVKTCAEVKRVLGEINLECREKGLNWRLLDSQLIEFEATYGAGTLGTRASTVATKCTPKKWIEIEVEYAMTLCEYRVPVETIQVQPKPEYLLKTNCYIHFINDK